MKKDILPKFIAQYLSGDQRLPKPKKGRGRPRSEGKSHTLLNFIIKYKTAHDGNSPSVREMAKAMDYNTTSAVGYHLDKLEAEGKIRRRFRMQTRSIEVAGGVWTHSAGFTFEEE